MLTRESTSACRYSDASQPGLPLAKLGLPGQGSGSAAGWKWPWLVTPVCVLYFLKVFTAMMRWKHFPNASILYQVPTNMKLILLFITLTLRLSVPTRAAAWSAAVLLALFLKYRWSYWKRSLKEFKALLIKHLCSKWLGTELDTKWKSVLNLLGYTIHSPCLGQKNVLCHDLVF